MKVQDKIKEQSKGKFMPTCQVAEVGALETELKQAEETLYLQAAIIANMSEGVYLVRVSDGVIVYANPKFEEMFGYEPGDLAGKHVSCVNAPTEKSPEETAGDIMAFIAKTGTWQGEVQNLKKDGTSFWCSASVSTFEHPEFGDVLVSVHTNITKHKQAEEELRENEEKLSKAFRIAPDAMTITTFPEGRFIEVNESYIRTYGYQREEIIGHTSVELDLWPKPEQRDQILRILQERGAVNEFEIESRTKSGDAITSLFSAEKIDLGDRPCLIASVKDITKRKQQEEKIEYLNQLLLSIFRVSEFIFREKDSNILIKRICDTLTESHIFRSAWVVLLDEAKRPVASAEAGTGKKFLTMIKQWKLGKLPVCGQKALEQTELSVMRKSPSGCGRCPMSTKYSANSVLTIRLEYDGKAYGLLSCCIIDRYRLGEEERELLQRIAGDIAFALHTTEIENQRRRAVDSLVKLTRYL